VSGPDRWLDSANPYIRSALLSEVVSADGVRYQFQRYLTVPDCTQRKELRTRIAVQLRGDGVPSVGDGKPWRM